MFSMPISTLLALFWRWQIKGLGESRNGGSWIRQRNSLQHGERARFSVGAEDQQAAVLTTVIVTLLSDMPRRCRRRSKGAKSGPTLASLGTVSSCASELPR